LGHKVHPLGFRLGVIRDWQAKWYADKHFADNLQEDVKLRQAIQAKYSEAGISLVEIERQANEVSITIHTAWPGVVIGRGGQRVEEIRQHLESLIEKKVRLTIREIQQPELDAYLVARTIAEQIGRRVAFRRAMKQAIFRTIQAGAKGVRISCAGRLGGAEIARRQTMHQGQVPLHTLRADIDYGFTEAHTTLGRIGIKVWIYKGDVHPEPKVAEITEMAAEPVVSEIEKVVPSAEAEAEVTKPAPRRKRITPTAEPEELPTEPVAEISTETVPPAEAEEKVAKPAPKRKRTTPAAKPEEIPAEPVAEISTETAPPAEAEEKVAKPAPKRKTRAAATTEPEEKPAEITADVSVEATQPTDTPIEEKAAKPAPRRKTRVTTATKLEEKDVTAETGEISQES